MEHSYRARVYIGSLSCEETTAREISSLRNLDEIARITWEPGRTHIYARAHERIHAIYARARIHDDALTSSSIPRGWRTCDYVPVYVCEGVGVFLHENSERLVLPCLQVLRRVECASDERKRYFARTMTHGAWLRKTHRRIHPSQIFRNLSRNSGIIGYRKTPPFAAIKKKIARTNINIPAGKSILARNKIIIRDITVALSL